MVAGSSHTIPAGPRLRSSLPEPASAVPAAWNAVPCHVLVQLISPLQGMDEMPLAQGHLPSSPRWGRASPCSSVRWLPRSDWRGLASRPSPLVFPVTGVWASPRAPGRLTGAAIRKGAEPVVPVCSGPRMQLCLRSAFPSTRAGAGNGEKRERACALKSAGVRLIPAAKSPD